MKKQSKKPSMFRGIEDWYQAECKELKRKKFRLKVKLILTVILPVIIVLVAIKAVQTFLRIKVREVFTRPHETQAADKTEKGCERAAVDKQEVRTGCEAQADNDIPKEPETLAEPETLTEPETSPVPAVMEPVEKEIVTPAPVGERLD